MRELWQNRRKFCPDFYTLWKISYPSFVRRIVGEGGDPFPIEVLQWRRQDLLREGQRLKLCHGALTSVASPAIIWGTRARAPKSTSESDSQLSKCCVVCEISWCRCQQLTQRRIQGGSLGSDEPPLRPGVVVENAITAWLYQSSSVRDIFTEIVPQ